VERDTFASLLLDIYLTVKPSLTILDGIWGMEGHGPANGEPRHLKLIAAGVDAVALDVGICQLLGTPLRAFPLYRAARSRGIGETDLQKIKFKGETPQALAVRNFQIPSLDSLGLLPGIFEGLTKRFLVSKPIQEGNSCAGCGECVELCPAEAIQLEAKKIDFDYDRCIRCYCCQEICPKGAIHFHKGMIVRLLNRFNR
jgi:ferredoxin